MDDEELELDAFGHAIADGALVRLVDDLEWDGGSIPANTQFRYSYDSIEQTINGESIWVETEELKVIQA